MTEQQTHPRRSRSTIIKLALAGLAILGIGTAITTAAWTDDTYFQADATTGSLALQGSLNSHRDFEGANTPDAAIVVPYHVLNLLTPNDVRSFDIYIRNSGYSPAYLSATVESAADDPIFDQSPVCPADVAFGTFPQPLDAQTTSGPITVTVTTGDWDDDCQNLIDFYDPGPSLRIKVSGTTAAS